MGEESTGRHCEVCGREKEPRKIRINSAEKPKEETGIDRVRQFISDTVDGSDRSDHEGTPESSKSTDIDGSKEKVFQICPHLPCDGREETIREMERWRMRNNPSREFSEEKLEKVVAEMVAQDKSDHQILSKNADEVYRSMVEEYEEDDDTGAIDE